MTSKIFVIKLKDIIKTAVFALLGIVIIIAIIGFVCGGFKSTYKEGTYNSGMILYGKPVTLSVTVSGDKIENIVLNPLNETQEVFYPMFSSCIDEVAQKVLEAQSTDISLNSDYTVTGGLILDAVDNALEQAKR